jgi:hypothetical protein
MGSRINLLLNDLLSNSKIGVNLKCHEHEKVEGETSACVENTASVTFYSQVKEGVELEVHFDCSTHEGKIELSKDFNFFRYVEGTDAHSRAIKLLRVLYENSISFTVHH